MAAVVPPVVVVPEPPLVVVVPAIATPEPAWLKLPPLVVPPSPSVLLVGLDEHAAALAPTKAVTKANWERSFMDVSARIKG
jgi:hypothetical protein